MQHAAKEDLALCTQAAKRQPAMQLPSTEPSSKCPVGSMSHQSHACSVLMESLVACSSDLLLLRCLIMHHPRPVIVIMWVHRHCKHLPYDDC